jgi:Fic family protein
MAQWLKFFLVGVIETAESSIQTFKSILTLKEKMEKDILPEFGVRQKKAMDIIQFLYNQPVVTINTLVKKLNINYATTSRIIKDLAEKKVLKELKFGGKEALWLFEEYMDVFMNEATFKAERK